MIADAFDALGVAPGHLAQVCFAFMLILARSGAAMALLPAVGEAVAPSMVRAGLAACIALLILPGVAPLVPSIPATASPSPIPIAGSKTMSAAIPASPTG